MLIVFVLLQDSEQNMDVEPEGEDDLPDADTDPVGRAAEIARRQEQAIVRAEAAAKAQDEEDDKAPTRGQKGKKNIKGRARLGDSTGSSTSATSGKGSSVPSSPATSQSSSTATSQPSSPATSRPSSPVTSTSPTTSAYGSRTSSPARMTTPPTSPTTSASSMALVAPALNNPFWQPVAPKRNTRSSGLRPPPAQVFLLQPTSSNTPPLVIDMTVSTEEVLHVMSLSMLG